MVKKILFSIALSIGLVHAASVENEKFQILANSVDTKDNILIAKDNVVIFSPSYYILAQKAIYDKTNGTFELFDEVVILQENKVQAQSNYAFLDVNKDQTIQNPVMLLDVKSNVWINSKDSSSEGDVLALTNSILSSCDCIDPAWTIRFTSGDYDKKEKWINTYNTRLYIKDVPLFYTPYFGFSTDKTRRTGLLPATVGYSSSEGVLFAQPIFIAPQHNYDIELVPQIKIQRGFGMYAYYRLADSDNSMLKIKSGFFKEKQSYVTRNSLKNDKHYGWSIDYERDKLFSSGNHDDELLLSLNWMNDIEYKNAEIGNKNSSEKKLESKINYYYETPEYYFGTYFRYYLDTTLDSNKTTLQELPQLQGHSFSKSLFWDKLLYSTDFKYTNYYREENINADRYELVVPISYSFPLLNDYLTLTLKEELTVIKQNYTNKTTAYNDATFLENRHIISLDTDLLKEYDFGLHTMNLSSIFTIPNVIKSDGDIYPVTNSNSELNPFPISKTTKTLSFALNHSLYSLEDLKQIINHKISQAIIYDDFNNADLGNLENEITLNYLLGKVSNRLLYNHIDDELIENSTSFTLDYLDYFLKLSYYMSKDTPNSGKSDLESYTIDAGVKFLRDYQFKYYENYNLEKEIRSKQGFTFIIDDKCWNLNLKLEKEITPSSSTTTNAIKQDIIYLELVLKPLGQINQKYKINDSSQ